MESDIQKKIKEIDDVVDQIRATIANDGSVTVEYSTDEKLSTCIVKNPAFTLEIKVDLEPWIDDNLSLAIKAAAANSFENIYLGPFLGKEGYSDRVVGAVKDIFVDKTVAIVTKKNWLGSIKYSYKFPKYEQVAADNMRLLTDIEKKLLEKLLSADFQGRDELSAQLLECLASPTGDDDGYGSIYLHPTQDKTPASTKLRVPVECLVADSDGGTIDILLHVVDGRLNELEIVKLEGTPIQSSIDPNAAEVHINS